VDLWLRPVEGGGLRVEIGDGRAESLPPLRTPDADEGRRGRLLAEDWGSQLRSAGTCVCELTAAVSS